MRRSTPGRGVATPLLCLVLASVGWLACGDASEPTAPAAPAAPMAPAGSKPAAAVPSPTVAAPAPSAAAMPKDVPSYPGAKVQQVAENAGAGFSARFATSDAPDRVAGFYAESLEAQGWSVQKADSADGPAVFADKQGRSLTVIATGAEDGTEIEMLLVELQ